jgi:NADPH-dependent 7-cyano-7-deazaguanine reductase QueF
MELLTQPNEHRCFDMVEVHTLPLTPACPYSGNPKAGSKIKIVYKPASCILEVASLRAYVDSYKGGKGDIRSMEGMIQQITQDCANAVRVGIELTAELIIDPNQEMKLICTAHPKRQ